MIQATLRTKMNGDGIGRATTATSNGRDRAGLRSSGETGDPPDTAKSGTSSGTNRTGSQAGKLEAGSSGGKALSERLPEAPSGIH